jgi:hypothetical protein
LESGGRRASVPGTSCPVIESVKGSDFVILVTEPTPFGLNDLKLAVEMVTAPSKGMARPMKWLGGPTRLTQLPVKDVVFAGISVQREPFRSNPSRTANGFSPALVVERWYTPD